MNRPTVSHTEKARLSWGDELADWIRVMADAADQSSQSKVAKQLGISTTQVSQIIGKSYQGNTTTAEARVRGVLMKETVSCPALGEIGKDVCSKWRESSRQFSPHNTMRVRMMRACRGCSRNKVAE